MIKAFNGKYLAKLRVYKSRLSDDGIKVTGIINLIAGFWYDQLVWDDNQNLDGTTVWFDTGYVGNNP